MKLSAIVKPFATALLQDRLDGKLRTPSDVLTHARKTQPEFGFTNEEWVSICDFILLLKPADNIPAAKKLAEECGLTLEY
jgi:hypothetical protein